MAFWNVEAHKIKWAQVAWLETSGYYAGKELPQGAWDHDQTLPGVDGHCPAMLYFRKSGAKGGSVVTGLEKRTKHQALQFLIAKFAKFEV